VQRLPVSAGEQDSHRADAGVLLDRCCPTPNALKGERPSGRGSKAAKGAHIPDAAGHDGGHLVSLLGSDSRDQDLLGEWVMAQPPQGIGAGCKALAQVAIGGGDRAIGAVLEPLGSS